MAYYDAVFIFKRQTAYRRRSERQLKFHERNVEYERSHLNLNGGELWPIARSASEFRIHSSFNALISGGGLLWSERESKRERARERESARERERKADQACNWYLYSQTNTVHKWTVYLSHAHTHTHTHTHTQKHLCG
jgi:hypothetical protein